MTPKYVMVGGITLDWILTADGEVGLKKCGGNALYSAAAAHLWTDDIAVLGIIGQGYPIKCLDDFQKAGIDLSAVRQLDEPHELVFAAQYDAKGDRRGINPKEVFPPMGYTDPEAMEEHDYAPARKNAEIIIQYDPSLDDVPVEFWDAEGFHIAGMYYRSQTIFAEALKSRAIPFSLDPGTSKASQIAGEVERQHLISLATVFMPSEEQIAWFIDENDPERAINRFAGFGPQIIVIKLGSKGSLVYNAQTNKRLYVPIYKTRAKDPTGAGDAFCGGFLVGLLETGDPFEAALYATVSASFVIEDFDARYTLQFTRNDAIARLNSLRRSLS